MRAKLAATLAIALLLLGACTAADDPEEGSDGSSTTAGEPSAVEGATGPSPGVTDDSIKVGITFVDLDAVREFVDLDQGDFEASYQAVIDHINDQGGIHGRMIEPVYAPVSPLGTAPAEEVCVRLTEDEDVFAVMSFFQDDQVLCPVAAHATATLGGTITAERYEQAQAPWFSLEASENSNGDVIRAMEEAGELDGDVALFSSIYSEGELAAVEATLDELGIEPVVSAVLDAPTDDLAAQNAATAVIMENFEAAGIEKILVVGSAALPIANGLAPLDYRPQLLFTSYSAISAYLDTPDADPSLLTDALVGMEDQPFEEEAMQECIGILEDAGITGIEDPADAEEGDPLPIVAAAAACRYVNLFAAIAEAAGPDLNYGTFQAAGESLGTIHLPGPEEDYTFGPYPDNDGNPTLHLGEFDPDEGMFVVTDG
jgi:hypothetical protein